VNGRRRARRRRWRGQREQPRCAATGAHRATAAELGGNRRGAALLARFNGLMRITSASAFSVNGQAIG
jgi:hypothetical protein